MSQIFLSLIFTGLCIWYAWYLYRRIKSGEIYIPCVKLRRYREPALFWSAVIIMAVLTVAAIVGILAGLIIQT